MESKRQQKMASLLQQELAAVLQRDLPHLFGGSLAPGISAVHVTPDLAQARVYLSLLLAQDAEQRLAVVRDAGKDIRHALAKRIGKTARVVPELQFFHDDSAAYAARMDEVFDKLDIPKETKEQPSKSPLFKAKE